MQYYFHPKGEIDSSLCIIITYELWYTAVLVGCVRVVDNSFLITIKGKIKMIQNDTKSKSFKKKKVMNGCFNFTTWLVKSNIGSDFRVWIDAFQIYIKKLGKKFAKIKEFKEKLSTELLF